MILVAALNVSYLGAIRKGTRVPIRRARFRQQHFIRKMFLEMAFGDSDLQPTETREKQQKTG